MNKKQLQKIIDQSIQASIIKGKISGASVKRCIKLFRSLSTTDAIWALENYQKGLIKSRQQTTLVIESATPLTSLEKKAVEKKFAKQFSITEVLNTVDSSLLGGLRVRIGDNVFDDSVTAHIDQLERSFA